MRFSIAAEGKTHRTGGMQRHTRLGSAVTAIVLGFVALAVVGFAGAAAIRDAAHHTRYSRNFPCH